MLKKENRQAEMFALVEELLQSKMTREEFCKSKGLSKNCFYYWQKKYRNQIQESHAGFISVRPGTGSRTGFTQPIILTYPNGISLQLPFGTPLTVISSLLRLA
jgi:hypothetical protein